MKNSPTCTQLVGLFLSAGGNRAIVKNRLKTASKGFGGCAAICYPRIANKHNTGRFYSLVYILLRPAIIFYCGIAA